MAAKGIEKKKKTKLDYTLIQPKLLEYLTLTSY
jgi:hypothetical protein